jgi:hypothetical protein
MWILMFLEINFKCNLYTATFQDFFYYYSELWICLVLPFFPSTPRTEFSSRKHDQAIWCSTTSRRHAHTWTAPKSSLNGDALVFIVRLLDPLRTGIQCEPKHPAPLYTYSNSKPEFWLLNRSNQRWDERNVKHAWENEKCVQMYGSRTWRKETTWLKQM